ncbi:MAG TPA: hypothetical protein VID73_09470 [Ktedonobacterales bacterium]|jgi:hypothetical protein
MTATTPEPPQAATPATPEKPLYVKLPPPGATHGSRPPTDAAHPLWQGLGTLLAAALCLSLPLAPLTIMSLLLIQPATRTEGLIWLWVTMIILIEGLAIFCGLGLWRELTGWSGRTRYQR